MCHLDLHMGNIVVADRQPLFVYVEFATASDPAEPCYDVVGPERSSVFVPGRHTEQLNANRHGVGETPRTARWRL